MGDSKELKAFLVDIVPDRISQNEILDRMVELENLVKTYDGLVVLKTIQKRTKPDYRTYVGSGKIEEIKLEMERSGANILIIGNIMTARQIYNINEILRPIGAKAWDRIDLILKIFERHAKNTESKLQIELAAIKHMGPRIFGMGMELSRQGGGSGSNLKGIGETNTEIMKRHLKEKEIKIRKKLDNYKNVRKQHRKSRLKKNLETVGIIGYTNAGKSSLLNSLTKKGVLAKNKLFATLGTNVGKLFIQTDDFKGKEILLNDTIGFIRDLPPQLIDAFSSTLEDSIESKILLHVVDASDPKIYEKINIVNEILNKIGANQEKIYVFNKIDLLTEKELDMIKQEYEYLNPIFISTYNKIGLENLKQNLSKLV